VETPIDREDVLSIMRWLMRLMPKPTGSWSCSEMKRKRTRLTREFWEQDARDKRLLAERIAYHEQKLKEEREAREKR